MMTIRTDENKQLILDALRERPVFISACRKARISKNAFHEWRRDDPDFNALVLRARHEGFDALEDALTTRGLRDDTTAAIFLLKSHRREVYGDRVDHTVTLSFATSPEWVAFRSALLSVLDRHPDVKHELMDELTRLSLPDVVEGRDELIS